MRRAHAFFPEALSLFVLFNKGLFIAYSRFIRQNIQLAVTDFSCLTASPLPLQDNVKWWVDSWLTIRKQCLTPVPSKYWASKPNTVQSGQTMCGERHYLFLYSAISFSLALLRPALLIWRLTISAIARNKVGVPSSVRRDAKFWKELNDTNICQSLWMFAEFVTYRIGLKRSQKGPHVDIPNCPARS